MTEEKQVGREWVRHVKKHEVEKKAREHCNREIHSFTLF
jgi:hypothetical protein